MVEVIYFIRRYSGRGHRGIVHEWRTIVPRGDAISAYGRYLRIARELRQGCVEWWVNGQINQATYAHRNRTRW